MPFLNLPSVRGADKPVSGSALGRVASRVWAIITDSDDGHVKLKRPDDTLLDLESGGAETFPQAVHDVEDHTGIPGVGGGGTLPILILRDLTGGTMFHGFGIKDPTPVTTYTVDRDDLGGAADPSVYPILPAGIYLGGGYFDFVFDTPPASGLVTAWTNCRSQHSPGPTHYPENDLGVDAAALQFPPVYQGNMALAPTVLFSTPGGEFNLNALNTTDQDLTWVRWVFWAVQLAPLEG